MATKNIGIADYAVSRAIMELQENHQLITQEMIADRINGGRMTVYRSLKNLKEAGLIQIIEGSSRAGGFRYEYLGE